MSCWTTFSRRVSRNNPNHVVDVEKIKSANDKADKEAKVGESVMNLSLAQCVEIHIQQNKGNIINFLKQTIDKIYPVGYYLRDRIHFIVSDAGYLICAIYRTLMLALTLFRELIAIEFPATTSSSKKSFLFLNECEETLLECIAHFEERLSNRASVDDKKNMTVALVKVLNTYSRTKQAEVNFAKISTLYGLLQETVKSDSLEIKALSIDSLFHIAALMDRDTLLECKGSLATMILAVLLEVYPPPGHPGEEARFVPPVVDGKTEPIVLQDLCIDAIAYIARRLEQTGRVDGNSFLEPIVKHFVSTGWNPYKLASDIFVRIIREMVESQEVDMLSVTVQYIYATLLDYLSYYARVLFPR